MCIRDRFQVADLADASPYQLSGGQKKRVALAAVVSMNPDILVLSGILNASTYIGSSLSTAASGAISDHYGWHATISVWAVTALAGTLILAFSFRKWSLFCGSCDNKPLVNRRFL